MRIEKILKSLSDVICSQTVSKKFEKPIRSAAKVISDSAPKTISKAAAKTPAYAAVKVNGIVVFMPVERIPKGAEILTGSLKSTDEILEAMQAHYNVVKKDILHPETLSQKAVQKVSQQVSSASFDVKPELKEKFDAIIKEMAEDKSSFGWNSGLNDMKKIMAGLDKLCKEGNMTVQGYAELAKTIDPDLPGFYWTKAVKMYNEFGANAKPEQTLDVVKKYLSGVQTVNGFSNALR